MQSTTPTKIASFKNLLDPRSKLSPGMQQYGDIKRKYMDHLLLFRMGDFYEAFFEDAIKISQCLNIALTHRGRIGELAIPMAGIPHHAASNYIDRLTEMGLKAAICEQIEDAKASKGIVKRAVTQVASPAMPFDFDKMAGRDRHYLTASFEDGQHYYLISIDFTTGEFAGQAFNDAKSFLHQLHLLHPKELVTFMGQWSALKEFDLLCEMMGTLKTHLSQEYFDVKQTGVYLEKLIPNYKEDRIIKNSSAILSPIGALAFYIVSTQKLDDFVHLRPFKLINREEMMKVTSTALIGLEILPKGREFYKDSLLGFLDKNQTAMGRRKLHQLLISPLRCRKEISQRQNFIQFLLENLELLQSARRSLRGVCDLERVLAKVTTKKVNARDLINLSNSVEVYLNLDTRLFSDKDLLPPINSESLQKLAQKISCTINDQLDASLDKGNLIRSGCHLERDRLASFSLDINQEMGKLEERYRRETGILKLKIKSNNVAGFFIEISKSNTKKIPTDFNRKQTLTSSERYSTSELEQFEKEFISAREKLQRLESEIFQEVIEEVKNTAAAILELASNIASLDCFLSLAWISGQEGFVRPVLSENKGLEFSKLWHPLVKNKLFEEFVAHDLVLDEKNYFGLLTGPNMAGKTTVMREVAIAQVLAQIGSFVPAARAKLSICDYLFSRLGANDDILQGKSTFMVEMSETAEIIRHATENSLVILDEVGRGTSTYDGLAIAWALLEYLTGKIKPLGLFATHYHQLIKLADDLPGAKNFTVETRTVKDTVQFLYHLKEGGTNQSFGIYVAKLAGLPTELLMRSQQILNLLEKENHHGTTSAQEIDFDFVKIKEELKELNLKNMTPLQALNKLHDMQNLIQ